VRALIVDKDSRPQWRPAAPDAVAKADVDAHFAPLGESDLTFEAAAR
jgi:enoyl-CoA hydratase